MAAPGGAFSEVAGKVTAAIAAHESAAMASSASAAMTTSAAMESAAAMSSAAMASAAAMSSAAKESAMMAKSAALASSAAMAAKTTCPDPLAAPMEEEPVAGNFTAHDILLLIGIVFTALACSISCFHIWSHARNYTAPKQQRQIIRILLIVPVFAVASCLMIQFYEYHIYIGATTQDFYESIVVASFFLLICQYVHVDEDTLKRIFNMMKPQKWIRALRPWHKCFGRNKQGTTMDGLKWFNIIWVGVFQFCVIKFLCAIITCITEATNVYCEESSAPIFAQIYLSVFEMISLVVAMLMLLQFYKQTKTVIAPHKPLLKFVAVKLAVFFVVIQDFVLSQLTGKNGPMKPTAQISYPSLAVGIPNALICFEMFCIALLHLFAYPVKPYRLDNAAKKYMSHSSRGSSRAMSEDQQRMVPAQQGSEPKNFDVEAHGYRPSQPEATYPGAPPVAQHPSSTSNTTPTPPGTGYQYPEMVEMESLGPMFSYESATDVPEKRFPAWKAVIDALNFWDMLVAVGTGFHWIFVARKHNTSAQYDAEYRQKHPELPARARVRTDRLSRAIAAL